MLGYRWAMLMPALAWPLAPFDTFGALAALAGEELADDGAALLGGVDVALGAALPFALAFAPGVGCDNGKSSSSSESS
eukprot:4374938-Pyramimonas_sp.AAC.1